MEIKKCRKSELRKELKMRLKTMVPEQKNAWDHTVCKRLFTLEEISGAEKIYGYMALSWETGTREILEQLLKRNIKVALPKVSGDRMDFYEIHSFADLKEGAFHIFEPKEDCQKICWPEAPVLVPGLAFTGQGVRLGKGGGFYDRFFEEEPNHKTVALAYEFQIVDEIPSEAHDRPVDRIVTERRII